MYIWLYWSITSETRHQSNQSWIRQDCTDNIIIRNLTHWGRVTHICVRKLTIIGSDNVLSPGRRQAIIWTNAGILLIGPLGTNFSEILIEIQTFSMKKMHLKMSSAKRWPFSLVLNVLRKVAHGKTCKYTFHDILRHTKSSSQHITINKNEDHALLSSSNSEGYRQVSNVRRTLVGNYIVDHSDVVGALPVGAAPTTSSFSI